MRQLPHEMLKGGTLWLALYKLKHFYVSAKFFDFGKGTTFDISSNLKKSTTWKLKNGRKSNKLTADSYETADQLVCRDTPISTQDGPIGPSCKGWIKYSLIWLTQSKGTAFGFSWIHIPKTFSFGNDWSLPDQIQTWTVSNLIKMRYFWVWNNLTHS